MNINIRKLIALQTTAFYWVKENSHIRGALKRARYRIRVMNSPSVPTEALSLYKTRPLNVLMV